MQNGKDSDARHPASENVDGIVGLNIDGGEAHQYEQWQHDIEQRPVMRAPSQNHKDGGHADMTAGEGCRRSFACCMGILYHVVEESVAIARHGKSLGMGGKVAADIGECAMGNVVETCCQVVILRSGDGQEDEDDVIDEKRRQDDEGRTVELLIAAEEVEQCHKGDHREIRCIAKVHEFAEYRMRPCLGEE